MKAYSPIRLGASLYMILLLAGTARAQTVVYSETFDALPSSVAGAANIQLGGSTKPSTAKYVEPGQWGFNPVGGTVAVGGANGNALQPRTVTAENGRAVGIFLDPSLFAGTGAGTYTLSFDVIPGGTGAGRVYIGAGSGYDLSRTTDAKLTLNLNSNGYGLRKTDGAVVWAGLTASGGAIATDLLTTRTEWIDSNDNPTGVFVDVPGAPIEVETAATLSFNFEYDGLSAVVLAFGAYLSDYKVDNITIATAAPASNSWAGYQKRSDGYVDTAGFLGWIWASDVDDYVWSVNLGAYLYLPEANVAESGAWIYVLK